MKNFLIGLSISLVVLFSAFGGALADRLFVVKPLDKIVERKDIGQARITESDEVAQVGGVVEVVDKVSPMVVTVVVVGQTQGRIVFDAFELFGFRREDPETVQQDIGSGFVVSGEEIMVVTNKHVVASLICVVRVWGLEQVHSGLLADHSFVQNNDQRLGLKTPIPDVNCFPFAEISGIRGLIILRRQVKLSDTFSDLHLGSRGKTCIRQFH